MIGRRDIPAWVDDIAHPSDPPLHEFFTRARYEFTVFRRESPWRAFLDRLAGRGEEAFRAGRPGEALVILDLVPGFLEPDCEMFQPWAAALLARLFSTRNYVALRDLQRRAGKRGSDLDAQRSAIFDNLRTGDLGYQDALRAVAQAELHREGVEHPSEIAITSRSRAVEQSRKRDGVRRPWRTGARRAKR